MTTNEQTVAYSEGDTVFAGVLFEPGGTGPGILLIHGGAGLDGHARRQARRYADLGHPVFACDMYGDGVAGDRERIMRSAMMLRDDHSLLVRRAEAGLAVLRRTLSAGRPCVAIGFCFGGMAALALARAGTDIAGAVSVHGTLSAPAPARPGAVQARILVCHGSQDPHVPLEQVTAFCREMDDAGADWRVELYGRAQHGFTHDHAVPGAMPGVAYDAVADERSFETIRAFLGHVHE